MNNSLTIIDRPIGFWEWPERTARDVGIVCDLLEELIAFEGWQIAPRSVKGGPDKNRSPDVVARFPHGGVIAFELTEWIDQKHLEAMIKGTRKYPRAFSSTEVRQGIDACIARKRGIALSGGPYELRVLLIHTAQEFFPETALDDLECLYTEADLVPWNQAYFMLPPLVGSSLARDAKCRYVKLHRNGDLKN